MHTFEPSVLEGLHGVAFSCTQSDESSSVKNTKDELEETKMPLRSAYNQSEQRNI